MKKLLFTGFLLLPILIVQLFGQGVRQLDEKNGFKDFNLGDEYIKWSSQLKFINSSDDITIFEYTGNCCNKLFDFNLAKIGLAFSDSKLVIISLTTDYFQEPYSISNDFTKWRSQDFEYINDSFTQLFGEPTDKNLEKATFYWTGQKASLTSKYEYLGVRNGDRQNITLISIDYLKKIKNKGF